MVAKWPSTSTFSYGYGRVKVLSGFVNGIFLLFIALFVLLESIARIMEPQAVESEKLLVVSVLGLLVNLLGIWAFHDLHGGGEHSHSHGHSHGHDHGGASHKKEKKKHKKHKEHGHEGHEHGGAHEHGGHEHSGHEHGGHEHGHKEHEEHSHHSEDQGHSHGGGHDHGHSHGTAEDLCDVELGLIDEHDDEFHHDNEVHDTHGQENIAGIYLHILADTLGSVGVIISALLIKYFGWTIADPICSFIISILIFVSTMPLLWNTSFTLLLRTPTKSEAKVRQCMAKISRLPEVIGLDEPHFWLYSGDELVGSLHVVVKTGTDPQAILATVSGIMENHTISDICIQIEVEDNKQ